MKELLNIAGSMLLVPLAGCGSAALFGAHPVPESPYVADAPWPSLSDTPGAPSTGTAEVPDPAVGVAAATDLRQAARDAAARAEALNRPVLTAAELRRLGRTP